MKKLLTVLGSTGSIGTQTLEVARNLGCKLHAIAANRNIKLLQQQAREFSPRFAIVGDISLYNELKLALADTFVTVLAGNEAVCEAASMPVDLVLNSIVGIDGLSSTLSAINSGNTLALANKESLVAAGELVIKAAKEKNKAIIPVDSEHSAIFQCLNGENRDKLKRVLLTASGGPFFGKTAKQLENVTIGDALAHPNWSMGQKISIDSATLMNKGLELIEAVHLFGVTPQQIEILVHRQSIVHSAVEFIDGAVMAQLGAPDMRIPISYAITYPDRAACNAGALSLFESGPLTFERPDLEAFSCLAAALEAANRGGLWPCAINGANEQAVALFLDGKISFCDIGRLVTGALSLSVKSQSYTIKEVYETDALAREYVLTKTGGVRN